MRIGYTEHMGRVYASACEKCIKVWGGSAKSMQGFQSIEGARRYMRIIARAWIMEVVGLFKDHMSVRESALGQLVTIPDGLPF